MRDDVIRVTMKERKRTREELMGQGWVPTRKPDKCH